MRALTANEIEVVSGGDGAVISATRIPTAAAIRSLMSRIAAPLYYLYQVANTLGQQIKAREDWFALGDGEETRKEVVDGHVHYVVWEPQKDSVGNLVLDSSGQKVMVKTDRFWMDVDGNGRLDTQFRITSDGSVFIQIAPGQWREQPRSDWRNGSTPPDPKQVVGAQGEFLDLGPSLWDSNPHPWLG